MPLSLDPHSPFNIQPPHQLLLSKDLLPIPISEPTSPQAIQPLPRPIFKHPLSTFKNVLPIQIPTSPTFIHLHTLSTIIDYHKFTTHSPILKSQPNINIFIIQYHHKAQ
ncbi:arginine deiminase family protein, partial [Staphylococcus epidermidis]|uniref:arginine deiminase family protein n=1 Tax=Staphylococcus epidermidis TaxID=1282 RepID=UPI0028CB28F2